MLILRDTSWKTEDGTWIGYEINDNLNIKESKRMVKIEDKIIFYLMPVINNYEEFVNGSKIDGYMEERAYTIDENKLEYEVINRYKITDVAGTI